MGDNEPEIDNEPNTNKLDLMILNNGWNSKNEMLIVSVGENSASYKWMHEKSNRRYLFLNKSLGLIIVIFNTTLLTQIIVTPTDPWLIIIQKIIIFVVTVLSIISNFLKYEELSANHLTATKNFNELYHDIQQEMCMYRKDRSIASKYVRKIIDKYDTLIISSPDINDKVLSEFKKKFQNSDIQMPDIADKIQKIDIVTQEPLADTIVNIDQPPLVYTKTLLEIEGEICEQDIPSLNKMLRKKELNASSKYEYDRLFKHE